MYIHGLYICTSVNWHYCMQSAGEVPYSVTLVGSASDTEGYVMILIGNSWRPLATNPSYWMDTHAEVVCHQLGYQGGMVPYNTSGYRLEIAYLIVSAVRINLHERYIYESL